MNRWGLVTALALIVTGFFLIHIGLNSGHQLDRQEAKALLLRQDSLRVEVTTVLNNQDSIRAEIRKLQREE